MEIVILDLEWNAAYSQKLHGYINEVIEFGAVKCGPDLVKKDTFSCLVKPQVGKKMNPYTAELTNLTVESLTGGLSFMGAVSRFRKWAGDCVILTWGTSDIHTLIENCRYFSGSEKIPFLSRYCDIQSYVQDRTGQNPGEQLGLARAAEQLGLDVSGMEHHRALDDSLMTLEVLKKLYDVEALAPYVFECDEDFYRRITFKTSYICDLNDPAIEKSHLEFSCPVCGGKTKRTSRWSQKNKGFRAEFRCLSCGYPFAGKLTVKQKYDGVSVTRKTAPVPILEAPRQAVPGELGSIRLDIVEGVGILRFPALENAGVNASFSTRLGGVSGKEFAAMNLGFSRGDKSEKVTENYHRFCRAAGLDPDSLVAGAQDHHVNIRRVGPEQRGIGVWREKDMDSIDGLCTDEQGVTLVIYCSDCVPLYFVDGKHHAIGLAHAGWRGTVSGMAKVMAERMAEEFGSRPEDLLAAVGPSICKECFEVDRPVAQEFLQLPRAEHFVTGPVTTAAGEEKFHVDLWECNRQFLLAAGLLPEHITVGNVCTMCESDLLFSHRKTRGKRGSNAAFLALR